MTLTRKMFFDFGAKLLIVLALVMFAIAWAKGQEVEPKQLPDIAEVRLLPNEIRIPELNLLKIQNLNFRFQLLVNQRVRIEQELQKIQAQVFTELENTRKSLGADSNTWNVDLVKGVFVRRPVIEEKKE